MKKIVSSALVIAVLLMLPMTLWAAEVSVVSDTDTKVFYYGLRENSSIKPTKGPAGWNSDPDFDESGWGSAGPYMHDRLPGSNAHLPHLTNQELSGSHIQAPGMDPISIKRTGSAEFICTEKSFNFLGWLIL